MCYKYNRVDCWIKKYIVAGAQNDLQLTLFFGREKSLSESYWLFKWEKCFFNEIDSPKSVKRRKSYKWCLSVQGSKNRILHYNISS